jgi:hypothetical protein
LRLARITDGRACTGAREEIRQRQENESELPPPPEDTENGRIHALIAQGLGWLVAYIGQERPRAYVLATEDDKFLWDLFDVATEDLYFSWTTRFGAFLDTGSFIGGALIWTMPTSTVLPIFWRTFGDTHFGIWTVFKPLGMRLQKQRMTDSERTALSMYL